MPTVNKVQRPWIMEPKNSRLSQKPNGYIPANFYRLAAWRKVRVSVLDKRPLCVHCQQKGQLTAAQMVDHIKPIRLGGTLYDDTNLMPLCNSCHARKRGKERHM